MIVELVRVRPELLPASVPPAFEKSTVPAKAAIGKANASKASNPIRFILPPDVHRTCFNVETFFGGFRPPLAVARNAFRSSRKSTLSSKHGQTVTY
jgi:hypothetical protein